MKFSKVVYFRYLPLTTKVFNDFYLKEVVDAGIHVEYWDLSALFFNNQVDIEDSSNLLDDVYKFKNYRQFEQKVLLQDIKNTLFISIVTYEPRVYKIFKVFRKYDCVLGVFGRNMFPSSGTLEQSLAEKFKRVNYDNVKNFVKRYLYKYLLSNNEIEVYRVVFQGGYQGWRGIGQISSQEVSLATIVEVNSDDYDRFLKLRYVEKTIKHDYILFLDEYLPLHPDTEFFNIKNVSSEDYYPLLNEYFDKVEKMFCMPVVIAAHPKALKYKDIDYFNGRQVFFGKSAELSRDAFFVLAHDSTSINYPIAFGTRLHFITSKAIEQNIRSVHDNVISFAGYLGCNWQYMDEAHDINVVDHISEELYLKYKYDFMCSTRTENRQTSQIFIEYLCN